MKLIVSPQLVDEMINGFAPEGAVLFSIGRDEWTVFGYLLHKVLGARWSTLGFKEGSDFKLAESVGRCASITMCIHSTAMCDPAVLRETDDFLKEYPALMVIIYGDIEADDPEDDASFTIVSHDGTAAGRFEGGDCARRFGFVMSLTDLS